MSIAKKYGVPEDTIVKMVNDGVISCSVKRHYEIYDRFVQLRSLNPSATKASLIIKVAEEMHATEATVDKVVHTLHKKT